MSGIWRIAKTEMLEHWRQPSIAVFMTLNYVFVALTFGLQIHIVDLLLSDPEQLRQLATQASALGISDLETLLRSAIEPLVIFDSTFSIVILPFFVSYMASYSVIHERKHHTLPFLFLSPISRVQLLAGKLLGILATGMIFHVILMGSKTAYFSTYTSLEPFSEQFGGSSSWWIAFLVGAPLSAAFVGALSALASGLAKDVRSATQFVMLYMTILNGIIGSVLAQVFGTDPLIQVAFAAGMMVLTAITVGVGSRVISRDIGP